MSWPAPVGGAADPPGVRGGGGGGPAAPGGPGGPRRGGGAGRGGRRKGGPARLEVAGGDQFGGAVRPERRREEEALRVAAAELLQDAHLLGGFYAFGDNGEAKRLCHVDDRGDDRLVAGVGPEALHEAPVDLDAVERHPVEVREG